MKFHNLFKTLFIYLFYIQEYIYSDKPKSDIYRNINNTVSSHCTSDST